VITATSANATLSVEQAFASLAVAPAVVVANQIAWRRRVALRVMNVVVAGRTIGVAAAAASTVAAAAAEVEDTALLAVLPLVLGALGAVHRRVAVQRLEVGARRIHIVLAAGRALAGTSLSGVNVEQATAPITPTPLRLGCSHVY